MTKASKHEFGETDHLDGAVTSAGHGMHVGSSAPHYVEIVTLDPGFSDAPRVGQAPPVDLLAGFAHEVISRLARRDSTVHAHEHRPSAQELESLCGALAWGEDTGAARSVINLIAKDIPDEEIYRNYLATAARVLGDWWTEDRLGFVEVTVGMGRIFELLSGSMGAAIPKSAQQGLSVVFASVPGEQHTLGVRMAADLFRSDGWDVSLKVGLEHDELIAEIARMPRCIVGLSVGGTHSFDALSKLVGALRAECPRARILVSGQDIADIRQKLSRLHVDGIAEGIDEAREKLAALWDKEMAVGDRCRG